MNPLGTATGPAPGTRAGGARESVLAPVRVTRQVPAAEAARPAEASAAPLGRTLGIARPAQRKLALAVALGAAAVAASIGLNGTAAWLLSRAAEHPSESVLAIAIVAVQFFGLSRGFARYGERLVDHDAAFRVLGDLRVRVYERLEALAPAGLPAFRDGDLLARMVGDVDSLQDLMVRVIPPYAIAVVVGLGTVAVQAAILPAAGVVLALALLLAATVVPWLTARVARRSAARQAPVRGELAASLVELVDGAADLVVNGAAADFAARIADADRTLTETALDDAASSGLGAGLSTALAGLAMWGSLAVGIPAVHAGRLDGVLLAVITLIPLAAFELVVGLPQAGQALERVRHAAGRVFAVLDRPDPVREPAPAAHLALARSAGPTGARRVPALSLHHVAVTYPEAVRPALVDVSVDLAPGRRVAVVGPSGAGKSTLAAALLRFVDYTGSATLEGTELAALPGDEVRRQVGWVPQDAHLFDTTVAENLRIGRRDATDEELRTVLGRVGLTGWVDELPAGLATEVGARGARLSGGQRQRLAVARALLADFPVLVLDEPAEHLDAAAADALTDDLVSLTESRSTVFITHRLAGLERVDEVLVMDRGRVVERGTHDELVAAGGRYAAMVAEELATREEELAWHTR